MDETLQPTPAPKPPRLVAFDKHQLATVQRAHAAFMQTIACVASCMGLESAQLNREMTGFHVDDV